MLTFVYKICPVLVLYIPFSYKWIAGFSIGPLVIIKSDAKDDEGLLAHELTHSRQFYRLPFIHWLLYAFNKSYRYKCVIEAHAVQLGYAIDVTALAVKFSKEIPKGYRFPDKNPGRILDDLLGAMTDRSDG